MHLPPPLRRLAAPALLALVLSGCGGSGSSGDGKAAEAPCPAASTDAATDRSEAHVARPVPKRDPRELDRMTAADARLVSLLRSVEQGEPTTPLQPAEPPHEARHEPVCPQPADAEAAGAH